MAMDDAFSRGDVDSSPSPPSSLLPPLFLFATSAALWTALDRRRRRRRRKRGARHRDGDGEDCCHDHVEAEASPPPPPPPTTTAASPGRRRIESSSRSSLSSSLRQRQRKHHQGQGQQQQQPQTQQRQASALTSRTSSGSWASFLSATDHDGEDDESDGERNGEEPSPRARRRSEDERRSLMAKISMHDAVLTRETSLDFHPKNSNWSHFENYAPSACATTRRRGNSISASSADAVARDSEVIAEEEDEEEEEEEEDFLWSDPPATPRPHRYVDRSLRDPPDGDAYLRRRSSHEGILRSNAGCLPAKLILVRHGQSEGNVDEGLYATKPDNALRLTKLGWDMAREAGRALREELDPDETVHFVVSPYARTVETFHGLASAWVDPDQAEYRNIEDRSERLRKWYARLMEMGLTWHEDPRIREQDFGNYQDPQVIKKAKAERHKFGSFYYRFPHGESASDVFDRVSTFLDSLWRSFESGRARNYVIVAHGITMRVFLARYFRYSIDQFHMLANPRNCEAVVLAHDGMGRMRLDGRCELELEEVVTEEEGRGGDEGEGKGRGRGPTTTTVVTGYRKHSRLRTLPPQWVRPRTVRMCYGDT